MTVCEFVNSSLNFWIPCMVLFIVMALFIFKRLPERPTLESAYKYSSDSAGWEMCPTQQGAEGGGSSGV